MRLFISAFVTVFGLSASQLLAAAFPVSGGVYTADVIRRLHNDGTPYTTVQSSTLSPGIVQLGSTAQLFNGDDETWGYRTNPAAASADATGTVVLNLGSTYTLGAIRQRLRDQDVRRAPTNITVRVSTDLVNWTTVYDGAPISGNFTHTFTPIDARYIEWTGVGIPSDNIGPFVELDNLYAFAASTGQSPDTRGGFDLTYLSGVTVTNLTPGQWGANPGSNVIDKAITGASGSATATADAQFLINLGSAHKLFNIGLKFRQSQNWNFGGRIEVSLDGVNFIEVFSQTTALGALNVQFDPIKAQYVRITNFLDPSDGIGTGTGRLDEVEIFALPEPSSTALLAMGGAMLLRRRRR
jgi:hypothetical protein